MSLENVVVSDVLVRSDAGIWGKDAGADGISILRSTNFRADGELSFENLAIKSVEPRDRDRKLLLPGDILVEKSGGGPKQPVGRVCFFRGDRDPHVFGNFIARLRVEPTRCDARFLFWFLHTSYQNGVTENFQKQTTGIRNLEFKRFLSQRITLPSLQEQRRFAELLDRAAEIRRRAEAARAKARAIIPALFLDTFGDPRSNPKGWRVAPLKDVAAVSYGSAAKLDTLLDENGGRRIVTISNVLIDGSIDRRVRRFYPASAEEIRKYSIRAGDLLFNWRSGSLDHIGKTAYVPSEFGGCLHVSFLLKVRALHDMTHARFLWAMFNILRSRGYFKDNSREQINRKFNASELSALEVALPPVRLQTAFAEQVERIEGLVRALDTAAAKAEAMAAALSAEMFDAGPRQGNGALACAAVALGLREM